MTEIKSLAGVGLETAQTDNRKENLRKGLMIAGGVALAGVSVFAAMRGKKIANLQKELGAKNSEISKLGKQLKGLEDEMAQLKLGGLIGENKAGLKVYKFIGQDGKEVLTTIDGKTGEVAKRITKQKNPCQYPWYELCSIFPKSGKSTIVHIEDFKTGETIYKVRSSYKMQTSFSDYYKGFHVESVTIKDNKISEKFILKNSIYPDRGNIYDGACYKSVLGSRTIEKDWFSRRPQRLKINSYPSDKVEITDKYFDKVEIADEYLLDIINTINKA